ncbi:MAG: arginine--tRNA ligase [Desulfobacterales bacterium]|jgi:arginyl-tRNA synthetase
MKNRIKKLIIEAASQAQAKGLLSSVDFPEVNVEKPKVEAHGDFSTNFAMVIASLQKMAPRKVAQAIVDQLNDSGRLLEKIEIAGPGFINFYVTPAAWHPVLLEIQKTDRRFGASELGGGQRVQVEFVSSNPTGPLHVGHGRGAAVGDSVANILAFCGYEVQREYYINDSGRQIQTLGRSVFLRYRELFGKSAPFPEDCYQGDYIREIAGRIKDQQSDGLLHREEGEAVMYCARTAAGDIMEGIREDLALFGVSFDKWFSEQSLYDSGEVDRILTESRERDIIYEKDGALWFKTSDLGDEKDRVVVRQNGQTTYFASDIAYHNDKYRRGFQRVIDVWGADHHGYIPRMQAAIEACGHKRNQFQVILVQLVNLLRGGQPVAMSTRAGEFVTLRDVIDEVGKDAARFIFLTRHYESPLDFDLEVAKQQTNENPVYYVQYVHARISSIIRKAVENGMANVQWDETAIARLLEIEEIQLIKTLAQYPETVAASAEKLEPHRITFFLMNLAAAFHAYYNKHRVLSEDPVLSRGRLVLVESIRKVIRNGLALLGVDAPDKM